MLYKDFTQTHTFRGCVLLAGLIICKFRGFLMEIESMKH